jgi:hypothetical protein
MMTMLMQSSAYEFPYGGRSNQFIFNEALIAANTEYEALRYKKLGDLQTAGQLKRCGHLAIRSIQRWLELNPPRHIKNKFPRDSGHGAEGYGFYDKYMITMGAFLSIGYYFADDSIVEVACPAERGGYAGETSAAFHKLFAVASGYSVQLDTAAKNYDATGLGRIHKAGIPTELGLSIPLSHREEYHLTAGKRIRAAIGAGWKTSAGKLQYLAECGEKVEASWRVEEETPEKVSFTVSYRSTEFDGIEAVEEKYRIEQEGVTLTTRLIGCAAADPSIYFRIPLLISNGADQTSITQDKHTVQVRLDSYVYTVQHTGSLSVDSELYGNRNGLYSLALLERDSGELSVHFQLDSL